MNPKLEAQLVSKYPILYSQRDLSMQETCMCWGFECGDGWFKLIDELSAGLEDVNRRILRRKDRDRKMALALFMTAVYSFGFCLTYFINLMVTGTENHPILAGAMSLLGLVSLLFVLRLRRRHHVLVEATQVKEKFGTLRFYLIVPMEHEDEVDAMVTKAEDESGITCEDCGARGKTRGKSWISTLCDSCNSKRYPPDPKNN